LSGASSPDWYSLFGGPKNVEQLAGEVHLTALYEVLYRVLSAATHGRDIIEGKISPRAPGESGIVQIRLATEAQTITENALSLAFELYRSFIKHYCPSRNRSLNDWYREEVRTFYVALSGKQIIHVI